MKRERFNNQKGESLVEIILITALFAVIGTGVVSTLLSSSQASKYGGDYLVARGYINEAKEAVRSIRDQSWAEMTNGTHGLSTSEGKFRFSGVSESLSEGFSRSIHIEDVYRSGGLVGNIAASGTLDAQTKKISVTVAWTPFAEKIKSLTSVFYVTHWMSLAWVQTLLAEFSLGTNNSSTTGNASGGEVSLASSSASWSGIAAQYVIDANGSGNMIASVFDETHNRLVTLQSSTTGNELQVWDVSSVSDSTPVFLRGMSMTQGTDLVVSGDYAYISADEGGSAGAEVVIVQLQTMTTIATIDLPQNTLATAIAVQGTMLAIGRENDNGTEELVLYSISSPSNPILLGSVELDVDVTDIAMNATHLFVVSSDSSQELTVVDRESFIVVQTIDLSTNADALKVLISGPSLYIGRAVGSSQELIKLDVSNVESGLPQIASFEVGFDVNGLALDPQETTLALATNNTSGELVLIDTMSLLNAQVVNVTGTNIAQSVSLYGTHVYLGTESDAGEVIIYGISASGWENPQVISALNQSNPRPGTSLFVDGTYAYVGTSTGSAKPEFTIYDVSDPTSPAFVGSYLVNATVNRIYVSGNYAFLAVSNNSSEFQVLNISNKSAPTLAANINLSGSQAATSFAVSGTVLYVGRNSGSSPEVYAINIANPSSPTLLGGINLTGNILDLGIYSTRLYAASTNNSGEMAIVNISNPSSLSLLSLYNAAGNQDGTAISVFSSTLILGRSSGSDPEIVVLNVSNATPSLLGSGQTTGAVNGLSRADQAILQVATSQSGAEYQRWDISTPTSPVLHVSKSLGANGIAVFEGGSEVYLATSSTSNALQIVAPLTLPDFAREAIFTSQAYDATSVASWDTLEWTVSGVGSVEFLIRTADTEANLANARWVGPLGNSASRYDVSGTAIVTDPSATGLRWIQYEAILSGNGTQTPTVLDISASYTP